MARHLLRLVGLIAPAVVIIIAALATPESEFATNQGDVGYYFDRARAVVAGQVPYRDVPLEYPPLALVPMVVPYLALPGDAATVEGYRWWFVVWQAVLAVVLAVSLTHVVRLGGWIGGRPAQPSRAGVAGRLTVLSAGAALALAWRFDLFPAVLATFAIWAALARRPTLAGVALGLGFLAKVYPVVLLPAVAAAWLATPDGRALVKLGGAAAVTVALGMLPFLGMAGSAALSFVGYQAARGLQIESIAGGIAVLSGLLTGSPPELSFGFSAVHVEGPLAQVLLGTLPIVTVLGFGLLSWVGWRRLRAEATGHGQAGVRPETIAALAFASLLLLLVTNKVYSIQYVVWIVPFVALLRGRAFWLGAAAVALTMPIHPLLYADLVRQEALPILVLNLRNGLVVALTAWLLVSLRRPPVRAGLQ